LPNSLLSAILIALFLLMKKLRGKDNACGFLQRIFN